MVAKVEKTDITAVSCLLVANGDAKILPLLVRSWGNEKMPDAKDEKVKLSMPLPCFKPLNQTCDFLHARVHSFKQKEKRGRNKKGTAESWDISQRVEVVKPKEEEKKKRGLV